MKSPWLQAFSAVLLALLMIAGIHFAPPVGSTRLHRTLIDFAHVPFFAVIALASLKVAWTANRLQPAAPGRREFVLTAIAVTILAVGSELAQLGDARRSASILDVLRNLAGGTLALLLANWRYAGRARVHTLAGKLVPAVMLAIMIPLVAPIAITLAAYVHRDAQWPTVLSITSRLDEVLLHPFQSEISPIRLQTADADAMGATALLVSTDRFLESGLTLQDLANGSEEFENVCIDLTNPGDAPFRADLRLGNSPAIFRATDIHSIPLTALPRARQTYCNSLYNTGDSGTGSSVVRPRYRSLSFTLEPRGTVWQFLVHRIWFE